MIYFDKYTGKSTHVKIHLINPIMLKHLEFFQVTSLSQSNNQYKRKHTQLFVMKDDTVFDLQILLLVELYIHIAQYFFLIQDRWLIVNVLSRASVAIKLLLFKVA